MSILLGMERGWLKPSEGKAAKSKDRSMIKVEERTFDKDII